MNKDNLFVYKLQPEDHGKKFEVILARKFHFSRKLLQKIKIGQNAWVDEEFVYLTTRGQTGQTLVVNLSVEEESTICGEDIPIDILYEDGFFLAVNKPSNQVMHPNSQYRSATLGNAVVGYWESKGESRPFRPISRIDRNTSGIVLIAKNRYAHQQLDWLSGKNLVEKIYLGIVKGSFPMDQGVLDSPIRIKPGSKIVREVHPEGLSSITLFETIKRFKDYTYMKFILITGRTHQIRVHCQNAGYPLLGDELYGGDQLYITRQALHCYSYSFVHPLTGQNLSINTPLPHDMLSLLDC